MACDDTSTEIPCLEILFVVCVLNCFSCVLLFATLWTVQPARLLCPWDSPGKNTGGGCHILLQGIFPTQGLNLSLMSSALAGRFFTISITLEALVNSRSGLKVGMKVQ